MGYQELVQQQQATQNALAQLQNRKQGSNTLFAGAEQLAQPEQKSVLNIIDRTKYGFADDIGQQQIIKQATGQDPIRLKNGQYGIQKIVNGQKVIQPVDPKGFQFSDLGGDIAESLGKGITSIGGALGGTAGLAAGGVGSIAGAGAGAAGGELVRQQIGNLLGVRGTLQTEGPNKGKYAKTTFGQMDNQDFAELATEGILGAGGQALALGAGKLLSNLTKSATTPAASTADDIISNKVKMTNLDQINKIAKVDMNDAITEQYLKRPGVYITEAVDKAGAKVGSQLDDLLVNGKETLNEKLFAPKINEIAQQMGLQSGDDVPINVAKASGTIRNQLVDLTKKNLSGAYDDQIKTLTALASQLEENPNITFGQLKGYTSEILPDAINTAKNSNSRTGMSALIKARQALTSDRDAILPPELFEQYTKGTKAINEISAIIKKKVVGGEPTPGGLSTAFKLGKLTNELSQGKNLTQLTSKLEELEKIPGFDNAKQITDDLYTFLASKAAYAKTPFTGGRLSLSGIADTVGKTVLSPANRLKMIKGATNLGILDKSQLGKQVGNIFPKVETIAQLINANQLIKAGTPLENILKQVSPEVAKSIKKVVKGSGGQLAVRSLNQILFGGNMVNEQ